MHRTNNLFHYFRPILSLFFLFTAIINADVKVAGIFKSNMVLQQQTATPVWGWASPGEIITVQFAAQTHSDTTDIAGEWRIDLTPLSASNEAQTMTITGNNRIEIQNILVGEVWLCSGQSNMDMGVGICKDPEKEIAGAVFPEIRFIDITKTPSPDPIGDIDSESVWNVCTPQSIAAGQWGGFSATAYFFGRKLHQELKVPIGLIDASWGATRIEPWTAPAGFASEPDLAEIFQNRHQSQEFGMWGEPVRPTYLYNSMIHPLIPFAFRGAIWYQGESNVGEGMAYHTKMRALINGWRDVWQREDFPFLFTQIAPWKGYADGALPDLWQAQVATLALPNTGIAGTMDISDLVDIHPKNKQDVGKRLALWALANSYGKNLPYCGPLYKEMAIEDGKIRLSFEYADSLASRDGNALTWFTIAEADHKFIRANAEIDGNQVIVWSDRAPDPVAVRFGWSRFAEPNLINGAGLPALPFRTDAERPQPQ